MEVIDNEVILSLGSDLGNKINNLENAIARIEQSVGKISKISSIYETMPHRFYSETTFYNLCLRLTTRFSSSLLLKKLQEIESEVGREKKTNSECYESRIIDIDVIYFNGDIISTEKLKVPHPKFRDRNFVLIPLVEIEPNYIDPVSNLTTTPLYKNCIDESNANKIEHRFSI